MARLRYTDAPRALDTYYPESFRPHLERNNDDKHTQKICFVGANRCREELLEDILISVEMLDPFAHYMAIITFFVTIPKIPPVCLSLQGGLTFLALA